MLAAPDAGGNRVGRYELIRRLAVGGMAEIYLARVPGVGIEGFEKLVVLKRILPQHAFDPELLRMFLDEARLSATLTHPHVTEVYDVGTTHDAPFFTMEYVHGANLRQLMKASGGRLPLEHALGIVSAAAAGLHYAHEKLGPGGEPLGIVHRDVSPSNVLVSYDGAVKVSDFGIAKWAFQRTQTQDGALKGKFAYMSPEQCKGQSLDRRSDVFALGTLLYELTTGAPPFTAAADYEIMSRIIEGAAEPPAWPAGGPPYPAALAAVVMRALARDPGDRFPTAQALQIDLEAFGRAERLEVSTVALAGYMQTLFADELRAWREAQRAGKSLAQHLAQKEARAPRRPSSPTVRTATDIFAAPKPGTAPHRARAAAVAALVLSAAVGGGVLAARRSSRARAQVAASTAAPPAAPTPAPPSTVAASGNIVESHPAVSNRAIQGPALRRAAKARGPASAAPAQPAAEGASLESRLKAWDPDSPVPP